MIRKKLDMHQLKEPEFFVYTSNVDTAFQVKRVHVGSCD